jgi:hypothetical protein
MNKNPFGIIVLMNFVVFIFALPALTGDPGNDASPPSDQGVSLPCVKVLNRHDIEELNNPALEDQIRDSRKDMAVLCIASAIGLPLTYITGGWMYVLERERTPKRWPKQWLIPGLFYSLLLNSVREKANTTYHYKNLRKIKGDCEKGKCIMVLDTDYPDYRDE